jgi:leucyl aminopeptidase (aminopeptidase T)
MTASSCDESALAVTAEFIARDIMGIKPGEQAVITADMAADMRGVHAVLNAARVRGANVALVAFPQLPYQGGLADPYIPEAVAAASQSCDVWFDFTFPYIAGSGVHAAAMKAQRARFLAFSDLGADGIVRLFGSVDYDRLFALQDALDALIADATGRACRVISPSGTDVHFKIAKPATRKLRRIDRPGSSTVLGSSVLYPEPASVQGVVVIEAAFHEYHTKLHAPIHVEVDGRIRAISGGGVDLRVMERSLRRAGGGEYGSIIHFSHAFHPAARLTGRSFVEDIRVPGSDAIGFGIPWWEPGGGENHPDGMITMQSLWIDNQQIVRDGWIIGPPDLVRLERELQATLH